MENSCSVKELIHSEDDIPVCDEVSDDTRDDAFFSELGPVIKQSNSKDNDIQLCSEADDVYSEDADIVEVEHSRTVNTYSDPIKALEDVCWYLEQKGYTATVVSSFVSSVAEISHKASSKQSFITDYFKDMQ